MNIDQLVEQFKTMEELKLFAESQFKQILQMTKKIKELEDKLKNNPITTQDFNNSTPLATQPSSNLIHINGQDDAKAISQVQLHRIKEASFTRELTLEEAKRVEIFNKILNQPEDKEKPLKADAKVLDEKELLNLVELNGSTKF